MTRWLSGVAVVAALAAGTTAAQAPAASRWSAPVTIASPGPRIIVDRPTLAMASGGRGLVTWGYSVGSYGHSGQRAAQRRPDASFGGARELRSWIEPPLAYKRDRAFALVQQRSLAIRRVRVVFGTTGGRFGGERTIYTGEPDAWFTRTRAAANARGDVAVAHMIVRKDDTRRIVLLERPAGGRFGAARVVNAPCPPPRCETFEPADAIEVALGSRGDLVVAWQEGASVVARVRQPGHRLGPAMRLGRGYQIAALRAAVSRSGAVWVTWLEHPHGPSGNGPLRVHLAVRAAGAHRFAPARRLDRVFRTGISHGETVRLALDPAGAGFVAWSRPGALRLASFDPAGHRLRTRELSTPGEYDDLHALATGARPGAALVVWSRQPSEDPHDGTQVMAGVVAPDGTYSGAEPVSDSLATGRPTGALDPVDGSAVVVWPQILPQPAGKPTRTVLLAARRSA